MKSLFYLRMACHGIKKNRKLYLPYLCTCIVMVMMHYIIEFLHVSKTLSGMAGGSSMQMILGIGRVMIAVFALIFLFYTNSVLMKGRKRELGLYNVLGMDKRNLSRIMVWENLIEAFTALAGGIFLGILFSKIAELCMIRLLQGSAGFAIAVEPQAILRTLQVFAVIFFLLLLRTLWQVFRSKPIELLHSQNEGERPPKANWLLALAGLIILGMGYGIAAVVKNPLSAVLWFLVAVLFVIVGTYLLFTAGSVTLCRLLQKNKKYYYQTNHFISVSSMTYRMRRNGEGLASICILCTMVIVMFSATTCLYVGTEDSLHNRYPKEFNITVFGSREEFLGDVQSRNVTEAVEKTLHTHGLSEKDTQDFWMMDVGTMSMEGTHVLGPSKGDTGLDFSNIRQIRIIALEDYNRIMGTQETLEQGETILCAGKATYSANTIQLLNLEPLTVKKQVKDVVQDETDTSLGWLKIYLVVPDFVQYTQLVEENMQEQEGSYQRMFGFDLGCESEEQIIIGEEIREQLAVLQKEDENLEVSIGIRAENRESFYGTFGGLFFIGILLGSVFLFATVLIMYYRQISEGIEDKAGFEIMQKVGMTKREIRRSINSQILTVFFLPPMVAGMHQIFAFPIISQLLSMFGLTNTRLMFTVTSVSFAGFFLLYMLLYRVTSGAYYGIVSADFGGEGRNRK